MPEQGERAQQVAPLGRRQVLLAQAVPAAPAAKHRLGDLDQWPPRLEAVGNDEKGRGGEVHLRLAGWSGDDGKKKTLYRRGRNGYAEDAEESLRARQRPLNR